MSIFQFAHLAWTCRLQLLAINLSLSSMHSNLLWVQKEVLEVIIALYEEAKTKMV